MSVERQKKEIPEADGAHFRVKDDPDTGNPIVKDAVEDGDTLLGERMPSPFTVETKRENERDDDLTIDGEYHRLLDLDTHETNAEDVEKRRMAKEEKEAMRTFIRVGRRNHVGEWPFTVTVHGRGNFGRPLIKLYRKFDQQEFSAWLTQKYPNRDIMYDG